MYWEGRARDSQRWAAECQQCVLGHAGREVKAPLHSVVSHYPFEKGNGITQLLLVKSKQEQNQAGQTGYTRTST